MHNILSRLEGGEQSWPTEMVSYHAPRCEGIQPRVYRLYWVICDLYEILVVATCPSFERSLSAKRVIVYVNSQDSFSLCVTVMHAFVLVSRTVLLWCNHRFHFHIQWISVLDFHN